MAGVKTVGAMLPAGAMVELNTDLIDEGAFRIELDHNINEAFRELMRYREKSNDAKGKVKIRADVVISFDKDSAKFVLVDHCVRRTVPVQVKRTYVKEVAGKLLCQPTGSSASNPAQQRLFDAFGKPIGSMDPVTGELIEDEGDGGGGGGTLKKIGAG